MEVSRPSTSANHRPRGDIAHKIAWGNKKMWGYVADMAESGIGNTTVPFEVTVVARVWFMEDVLLGPEK